MTIAIDALAKQTAEAVESALRDNWRRLAAQPLPPNVKGSAYERTLAEWLKPFFPAALRIETNAQLLDRSLRLLPRAKENEWDVVGIYAEATPNMVLRMGDAKTVPFDALFFIASVKSVVTKPKLKGDLAKFESIHGLESGRMMEARPTWAPDSSHVLKILAYDRHQIKEAERNRLLAENMDHWDAVLVVDDDFLLLNPRNDYLAPTFTNDDEIVRIRQFCLLQFVLFLSRSMATNRRIDTFGTFNALIGRATGGVEPRPPKGNHS